MSAPSGQSIRTTYECRRVPAAPKSPGARIGPVNSQHRVRPSGLRAAPGGLIYGLLKLQELIKQRRGQWRT